MLLNLLRAITDLAVLVARLTTEDLGDKRRMALVGQFVRLQALDAAFQFDFREPLMILITALIIVFWRAWKRARRRPCR